MPTSQMSSVVDYIRKAALRGSADLGDRELLGRFLERRDQLAFTALVERHGRMVWGVCRRMLSHHDAEDAFQATFLILVRKASSIIPREMLGNWLYGVAHRTALQARRTAARRSARELQVMAMPDTETEQQDQWGDVQPLLDEELSRLPDIYRVVIVLCDLESRTRKEVARELGVPEGTVGGRLARARTMLAKRLTERGVALSDGALATALAQQAASGDIPKTVVESTIQTASLVAAGNAAVGAISARAAALMKGVMKTLLLAKLKTVVAILAVVLVIGYGSGLLWYGTAGALQIEDTDGPTTASQRTDGNKKAHEDPFNPMVAEPERTLITPQTKKAIDIGLEYLAKHQAQDGSWVTGDYRGNVAMTSLAGRAFLAAGYLPDRGPNAARLTKAIEYVLQSEDGGLLASGKAPMFEHGFAVRFLAEAYGKVTDKALKNRMKATLIQAVKAIVDGQNDEGGWRYRPRSRDADITVTCCQLHALAAAKFAGFETPQTTIDKGIKYIFTCQDQGQSGRFRYLPDVPSNGPATYEYTAEAISALNAVGIKGDKEVLERGTEFIRSCKSPSASDVFFYDARYYAAPVMSAAGGEDWEMWYTAVRGELLDRRNKYGGWDDPKISSCFNTAIALIILQSGLRIRLPATDVGWGVSPSG